MSDGTVARPFSVTPQHAGVPSVLIAHVWFVPAVICDTVPTPPGAVDLPFASLPQHTGAPFARIAQVCRSPAAICTTAPAEAGTVR
jgi:hypothetical protein